MKVAFATEGSRGLDDIVSSVFARAKTFTIVTVEGGTVKNVEVVENLYLDRKYGVGPLVIKMLSEKGVDVIVASIFGEGAKTLLGEYGIIQVSVPEKMLVRDALTKVTGGRRP